MIEVSNPGPNTVLNFGENEKKIVLVFQPWDEIVQITNPRRVMLYETRAVILDTPEEAREYVTNLRSEANGSSQKS